MSKDSPGIGLANGRAPENETHSAGEIVSPGQGDPIVPAEPEVADSISVEPAIAHQEADEIEEWNARVRRSMRKQTRRSFLTGGAAALAGLAGWWWLSTRRDESGIPWPLRQGLQVNEELARDYFRPRRRVPNLNGKARPGDRVNGDLGLDDPVDPNAWRLNVEGLASQDDPVQLTLAAIKRLPRFETTAEFKCIEGWSVVVEWAGVRFSDFMAAYPPTTMSGNPLELKNNPGDLPPYAGMATPDRGYYVGLDMESLLQPQTMLAYEMNGAPLTQEHGAPLRLVTPVKYGVKSIKRIGTISYGASQPADYWAEQGYDWYLGL